MLRQVVARRISGSVRRFQRDGSIAAAASGARLFKGSNPWQRFLEGGLKGISEVALQQQLQGTVQRVHVSWVDGHKSEFSTKWLIDHATEAFNSNTKQRQVDTFEVPNDVQALQALVATTTTTPPSQQPSAAAACAAGGNCSSTNDWQIQVLRVSWGGSAAGRKNRDIDEDGTENTSTIPIAWLRQHCTSPTARGLRQRYGKAADGASHRLLPVLWDANVFSAGTPLDGTPGTHSPSSVCMDYDEIMADQPVASSPAPPASARLVGIIRSHGIALVRGVPTTEVGTEALALKIGGHLRSTLYGPGMWATSAEASAGEEAFRDSAYSNDALALHTDCGYLADPPGIQVFNCVVRAKEGGASFYMDGFAVAERLRSANPEAFEFFSRTPLSYQCFDDGCHYMAEGPVFRLGSQGEVVQVRHNDYDRAPLDYRSSDDIDRFYEHHKSLSGILRDPSLVARILLEPGDCVIIDNHRTLHGRESFEGRRRMVGCYLGMDELHSAARVHGM